MNDTAALRALLAADPLGDDLVMAALFALPTLLDKADALAALVAAHHSLDRTGTHDVALAAAYQRGMADANASWDTAYQRGQTDERERIRAGIVAAVITESQSVGAVRERHRILRWLDGEPQWADAILFTQGDR